MYLLVFNGSTNFLFHKNKYGLTICNQIRTNKFYFIQTNIFMSIQHENQF